MTDNSLEQNPEQSRTLSVNDDHQIHDDPPRQRRLSNCSLCSTATGQNDDNKSTSKHNPRRRSTYHSDVMLIHFGLRTLEDLYVVFTNHSTMAVAGGRNPPISDSVHIVMH